MSKPEILNGRPEIDGFVIMDNAKSSRIVAPISANFEPKPDITAYELAQLLPYFFGGRALYEVDWEALGSANRHLMRNN